MKPQNNLPPESQAWVRDIERQLTELKRADTQISEINRKQELALASMTKAMSTINTQQEVIVQREVIEYDYFLKNGTGNNPIPAAREAGKTITPPAWATQCKLVMMGNVWFSSGFGDYSGYAGLYLMSNNQNIEIIFTDVASSAGMTKGVSSTKQGDQYASVSGLIDLKDWPGSFRLERTFSVTGTQDAGYSGFAMVSVTATIFFVFS